MRILPPGVNPEPVTIYNKMANGNYKRTVIQGYWFTSLNKAVHSRGVLPLDTVSIYIFNTDNYVPQGSSLKLKNWTVGIGSSSFDTYIFRGIVDYKIEDNRESIRKLDELYKDVYKKPKVVEDNRQGLKSHRHLVIIC